ncbi:MAG TPA: T9SS type A sorting domain-containing protein, partial [Chitinophagales bacterium]|nr:T9SS type A sorting domain-containing protein [Chitinophagales bacterium]
IYKLENGTVDVAENNLPNSIQVFPNPFVSGISINIEKQNAEKVIISVRNILGQPVFTDHEKIYGSAYTKNIDLGSLSKGVYLLELHVDGERTVRKMLKE